MNMKLLNSLTGSDEEFAQGLVELGWYRYPPTLTNYAYSGEAREKLKPQFLEAGEVGGTDAWVYRLKISSGKWQDAVAIVESQLKKEPRFAVVFCNVAGALLILVPSNPDKAFARAKSGLAVDRIYLDTRQPSNFEAETIKKLKEAPKKHFRARLQEMVNTERVTKKFYDRFKKELDSFQKLIDGITVEADRLWYSSVMLNRLMFIYFLQRKGFLDGDRDYMSNRLKAVQERRGKDEFQSFYRCFLLRLFHEGLGSRKRELDFEELLGRIPYLNGGLFEVHDIESRYVDDTGQTVVDIPDDAFESVFAFFNDYEWCLDTRPSRTEREINPDVLGYIFEKYINQKQMGAYYTKEDITEYISKNTIIPYIFDTVAKKHKAAFEGDNSAWLLLQIDPDWYIYEAVRKGVELYLPEEIACGLNDVSKRDKWNTPSPEEYALPTEIWREVVARRKRYAEVRGKMERDEVRSIDDLITLNLNIIQFARDVIDVSNDPELIRAIWNTMAGRIAEIGTNAPPIPPMTVLDPTCGSGAFLFAALNILEPLYEGCLNRMQEFVEQADKAGDSRKYPDFRSVLSRMNDSTNHPNRDYFVYKSIILNNLYGVDIMPEAVEICKLRLFLKLASVVEPSLDSVNMGLEPLPDIDFNIRAGNTLVGFATEEETKRTIKSTLDFDDAWATIEEKIKDVNDLMELFRQQQTELGQEVTAEDKANLQLRLAAVDEELNRYLAEQYGDSANDYNAWLASHQPFHWYVEFYGIMKRGGFDVIIGNPPYVEYSKVKDDYTLKGYSTISCGNLYAYVIERCDKLLKISSRSGMIIPHSSICTDRMAELQSFLKNTSSHFWVSTYCVRPAKLFDGVDQRLAVYVLKNTSTLTRAVLFTSIYHRWASEIREHLFPLLSYVHSPSAGTLNTIPKIDNDVGVGIYNKMLQNDILGTNLLAQNNARVIFYHNAPRYWNRAMDFTPYFWNERDGVQVSSQIKTISVRNQLDEKVVVACLNSTLFYWWFIILSDCRHLNLREIEQFPVSLSEMSTAAKSKLAAITEKLMLDLKRNSSRKEARYSTTGRVAYDEFYPRLSKPIIDEIDRVLAEHYGFTDEELDFIINYDIKYRMGLGGDSEDD